MLRFLEIVGVYPDDKKSFAFFDTVKNRVLEFDGEQVFDDIEEFDLYYTTECGFSYDRLISLIPKYYFNKQK
jgi:hypothetical protein